MDLIEINQFFL